MTDISALYPQPPTAQPGILSGDPAKVIGTLGSLNALATSTKTLAARTAVGEAYRNALNPDGTVDLGKLSTALKSNPDASFGLPETTSNMLDQHGKMISNSTAQFGLNSSQNAFVMDGLGALADKPNLTREDVRHFVVTAARNTNIPGPILSGWLNGLPQDPKALRQSLVTMRNMATGSAGLSAPTDVGVTSGGAPVTGTRGQFNYGVSGTGEGAGGVPGAPGGVGLITKQPVGEETVQGAAAQRASDLQATASSTAQYHADLDNLKQDSKILDNLQGPSFEVEKKINQLTQRIGGFGITMTPEQLRAGESFDKIANQISLNQSKLFHGSDAGLHTVVGANPSTSMSRYGRDGVIDMLHGNQDAIDTTRKLWLNARAKGAPANSYDQFVNEVSQVLDPRVFQFNRLNRENQQKFLSQMEPGDLSDFERKYQEAITRKWVKPLKGAANARQ